jgi:deoxycytidine triphosphate deaminase
MILSDSDLVQLRETALVILPFDPGRLTALGYDLRIGAAFVHEKHSKQKPVWKSCESTIQIQAGYSAVIVTQEYIWLSWLVAATIQARGSLSLRGLSLNPTTVDPNFRGRMIFRIYNVSTCPIDLSVGESFATMTVHSLLSPAKMRPISSPREHIDKVLPPDIASYAHKHLKGSQAEEGEFDYAIQVAQNKLNLGHRYSIIRFLSRHVIPICFVVLASCITVAHTYGSIAAIAPAFLFFTTVYSWLTKNLGTILKNLISKNQVINSLPSKP